MITLFLIVITALLFDQLIGEPRRFHPLVGFGNIATLLEKKIHYDHLSPASNAWQICKGGLALFVLIGPFVLVTWLAVSQGYEPYMNWLLSSIILYWAIGYQSLIGHVERIVTEFKHDDLSSARHALSMVVSRDTEHLNQPQIIQASIETTLENGSDAIFAPIFWFCLLGAPGVVAYRLINTLDAMWGYKNARYLYFGRVAAKLDDVMNFIPARLVAFSYAMLGNFQLALHCWRTQSPKLNSPNAGPVMTAGAGSLNIRLGGPAYYQGQPIDKPYFGSAVTPQIADVQRTLNLIHATVVLWCAGIACVSVLYFVMG